MMGMNVSEGAAQQPRGTGVWDVRIRRDALCQQYASHISCSQSPQFWCKDQAGACGGCPQHPGSCGRFLMPQCIPGVFPAMGNTQKCIPSACQLSHRLALNSRYWVAAQKILSCQKVYYIQLDVWNGNLFRIKHQ